MADTAAPATAAASATPKKSKAGASKKPKVKPSHPPTSSMVKKAIKDLKERGGSSLQAIKKFISATYKIDAEKISPFIRKYLKNAVASGELVQTKGKGASGSFKLASAAKAEKPAGAPKKAAKKPVAAKAKKAAPKTPKKAAKKPAAKPKKSPSKAKKTAKAPTKPKAPKPKKVAKKSPKKAAPKRK